MADRPTRPPRPPPPASGARGRGRGRAAAPAGQPSPQVRPGISPDPESALTEQTASLHITTEETGDSGTPEAATTKVSSTSSPGAAAKKVFLKDVITIFGPHAFVAAVLVFQVSFHRPAEPEYFRGKEGAPKNVASNYLKLECDKDKGIYHYEVDFEPRIDNRQECFRLLNSLRDITGPVKVRIWFIFIT